MDPTHWNEVYEGLILPAIEEAGLQADRDDADTGSRVIIQGILKKLENADLILCDLSSHNANVFLELGWALRADKPFVLIKDDFTDHKRLNIGLFSTVDDLDWKILVETHHELEVTRDEHSGKTQV